MRSYSVCDADFLEQYKCFSNHTCLKFRCMALLCDISLSIKRISGKVLRCKTLGESAQAFMSLSKPRPKIHRPPSVIAAPAESPLPRRKNINNSMLIVGVAAAVIASIVLLRQEKQEIITSEATDSPPALAPAAGGNLPDSLSLQRNANGKTIVIKDKKEIIIGQLAKIPAQNEQITEIKSMSEVDGNAGRELLAIISKY